MYITTSSALSTGLALTFIFHSEPFNFLYSLNDFTALLLFLPSLFTEFKLELVNGVLKLVDGKLELVDGELVDSKLDGNTISVKILNR